MKLLRPLLAFALASSAFAAPPSAAHVKAGVSCADCHGAGTPSKAAKQDACVGCHGDLATVAAATKALAVNPHDSHLDDVTCTECHRQHRKPVVKCLDCHPTFAFNPK